MTKKNKIKKVMALKEYIVYRLDKESQAELLNSSEDNYFLCYQLIKYRAVWQRIVKYYISNKWYNSLNATISYYFKEDELAEVENTNAFRAQLLANIISLPAYFIVDWFDEMGIDWNEI
jgi:hypothetical protein